MMFMLLPRGRLRGMVDDDFRDAPVLAAAMKYRASRHIPFTYALASRS